MKYSFKQYQPLSLRLWHWLNALTIFGLVATVVLRKTFLSWRANSQIIQEKSNHVLDANVANTIAKSLRDQMWDWHYYLGFVLSFLLLWRICVAVRNKNTSLKNQILTGVKEIPTLTGPSKFKASHYTLVKTAYALFYIVLLYMVLSGITLYFEDALKLSETLEDGLQELHEAAAWFFYAFIVAHIAGVIAAEVRGDSGLISDMFNGGNKSKE
ncbi:cytochrome b/b6 domain-containing protein [Bdellovibrio sp. NC01]|uniref:cytochrome b/b6 domain-containing protein n=1 Tax=Bdellovibrio sp. NC01 TaxID=2220073 RepID=UPI0011581325|nr:cytochrome b/b6 domain-containing protein [Bdellovibrio sp. NC01]QDK37230.1 cytochrome b/b6 domain-containing protein [Bdellovibrio sp. NC01]